MGSTHVALVRLHLGRGPGWRLESHLRQGGVGRFAQRLAAGWQQAGAGPQFFTKRLVETFAPKNVILFVSKARDTGESPRAERPPSSPPSSRLAFSSQSAMPARPPRKSSTAFS